MLEIPQPEEMGQSIFSPREKCDSQQSETGQSPEADLIEAERILSRRAVELVRAEFEPCTWEAWWKTAVEGRQAADVAADMGMSLAAVYKAKSRVLLRLRQELAGLQG
jgi:RNA polymerase sigma-70 factor (ECF subfamily)